MRRLALLLFPLALGCQDEGGVLGETDAGPSDAGFSDAGAPDGGVPFDAGSLATCAPAAHFSIGVSGFADNPWEGEVWEVDDPAQLTYVAGEGEIRLSGELPVSHLSDSHYFARVEYYQPFWTEARVTFWRADASGRRGSVAFIGFSGGRYQDGRAAGLPEVTYDFTTQGCLLEDTSCGVATGLAMRATVRGEDVLATVGMKETAPTYEVFNSGSHVYEGDVLCEDLPRVWTAGWFALAPTRDTGCEGLQRDVCVGSPGCVLWGSEESDPGYVCRPARGFCEMINEGRTCNLYPECSWSPGDCYCPEGTNCTCGGGSAPMCKSVCAPIPNGACPEGRTCADPGLVEDMCAPLVGAASLCEWAPDDCDGAPNDRMCACGANGLETFANDCERRRAGAGAPVEGACPP